MDVRLVPGFDGWRGFAILKRLGVQPLPFSGNISGNSHWHKPMHVLLRKIDPDQGMNRWYMIAVQAMLLEPLAVVCAYGSWETPWPQLRVLPVSSLTEAQDLADTILDQELNRGYQVIYQA